MKFMKPVLPFVLALLISPVSALLAQATLTNDDIAKLVKSGLSEDFILNLIDQQDSRLSSDVPRLIELKNNGVGERIIAAVAQKNPPREPLTSYGLIQLAQSQFSDGFVLDLVNRQSGQIAGAAGRVEARRLERAGDLGDHQKEFTGRTDDRRSGRPIGQGGLQRRLHCQPAEPPAC